jgi:D-alanyl-D-alanine carboxypeptidase
MSKKQHRFRYIVNLLCVGILVALLLAACGSGDMISLEADPPGSAELIGAGRHPQGKEITVRAVPARGWEFVNWTRGPEVVAETPDYTFTVEGRTKLMAHFRPREYAIAAFAQGQGNVTYSDRPATHGDEVVVRAVPASGYRFAYWSEDGEVVNTNADYPFAADGDRNLTAVFLPEHYVVSIEVRGEGGQVVETWSLESGPKVTLKAIAQAGYEFFGWVDMDNDQELSVDVVYTFAWDGPKDLVARFRELLKPVEGSSIVAVVSKKTTLGQYSPDDLVELPSHISAQGRPVRQEVAQQLELLVADAKAQAVKVRVVSGYRSYETQKKLFFNYARNHGVLAAERFSARPGQSEHQLGTAVDFGGTAVDFSSEFGKTEQGRWLFDNAHKYGFALSYPKDSEDITGYIYEPWHFRYIGVDLAIEWKQSGLSLIEFLKTKNQAD